jgi:thiamine biosynthesis lipoprotein
MEYDEFSAMNTTIQVAAEGSPQDLAAGFALVRRVIAESEQRFSRFRSDSELSQLNRSAGTWFQVSADMITRVQAAVEMYDLTDRFFDPSILGALKMIGYDRSMDEIRQLDRLPGMDEYTWVTPPFEEIRLDVENQRILLPRDVQIDLGGIAKGWIAEQAARKLAQYSPACAVSAGGDMAMLGTPSGEDFWQVSLEDPRDPENVLAILKVPQGAVATSSITKRYWLQGDQPRNHIIDPRVGYSIDPEWLSVSVYAPQAAQAEAFAKAILIAGPQQGPLLAARVEGLAFIAVEPDGSLWGTPHSKEIIYVPEPIH